MRQYRTTCQQCGGVLKGYYDFYVCTPCYSANNREAQKKLLEKEKSK